MAALFFIALETGVGGLFIVLVQNPSALAFDGVLGDVLKVFLPVVLFVVFLILLLPLIRISLVAVSSCGRPVLALQTAVSTLQLPASIAGFLRPILSRAIINSREPLSLVVASSGENTQLIDGHDSLTNSQCENIATRLQVELFNQHLEFHLGALGEGDGRPKRLLVTDFFSYAKYVRELTLLAKRIAPPGYQVACFCTWSQTLEKWFNYLRTPTTLVHVRTPPRWTSYLEFWADIKNVVRIERAIFCTEDKLHGTDFPSKSEVLNAANSWIFSRSGEEENYSSFLLTRDEIQIIAQHAKQNQCVRTYDFIHLEYLTDFTNDERSHLIIESSMGDEVRDDGTADEEVPGRVGDERIVDAVPGFTMQRLGKVFARTFHNPFPNRASGCYSVEVNRREVNDMTARGALMSNHPDDLFMIGLVRIEAKDEQEPVWLFGLGGDLEPGLNGLAVEFVSRCRANHPGENRWRIMEKWVTTIRNRKHTSL